MNVGGVAQITDDFRYARSEKTEAICALPRIDTSAVGGRRKYTKEDNGKSMMHTL